MGHRPLEPCQVIGCGYGRHRYRLCYRHSRAWDKAGHPTVDQWWTPTLATMTSVCALPGCSLWAELDGGWCRSHHTRWRQRGGPPAAEFIDYCASYGEDQFGFGSLRTQSRLEIQYAIQCRVDANRTRTTPRSINRLLDHLAVSATISLLDHSMHDWLARLPTAAWTTSPRAFLGYAIDCLLDVRDGTGWDGEYPRDVWLLRRLGIAAGHGARLDFTPVQAGCGSLTNAGAGGASPVASGLASCARISSRSCGCRGWHPDWQPRRVQPAGPGGAGNLPSSAGGRRPVREDPQQRHQFRHRASPSRPPASQGTAARRGGTVSQ